MSVARVRSRLDALPWLHRTLLVGAVAFLGWTGWSTPGLDARLAKDLLLFVALPGALAATHGRHLGWRVDRAALRNTALLAAFVLPVYLVGSSLPSIRSFYPMWWGPRTGYWPHAAKQFLVVVAAETYYRGLLCVGLRELGRKAALVSPVVYAFHHVHKPPIELLLSAPTDVLFGLVDYESDSILPSVVAHGAGLALLDWLVVRPPLIDPRTLVRALSWLPAPL